MAMIYIVEDDRNIQEIEAFALKNSGYQVCCFENAKEFYKAVAEKTPQLVLLDIMLPDEDGLSIIRKLRNLPYAKKVPVIMVTAKSSEMDKVKGLDYGADDYITKPFGVLELISRVKAVLRRIDAGAPSPVLRLGKLVLNDERRMVTVSGKVCELTYKEYELLRFLLENRGVVLSRGRIMERVWGMDFEGESRTVDMHIKSLRQKLVEADVTIKTVRHVGYVIEEGQETT